MADVGPQLLNHIDALTAFVRRRVSDPDLASDTMQEALLRAIAAEDQLQDEDRLLPWFYRILRRTIIDGLRLRGAEQRLLERFASELTSRSWPNPYEQEICLCFRELLPTLKPEYAELIEELDLKERPPRELAEQLGITLNNLKVRRHRARAQLRLRLEESCRVCALHGCTNCTCRGAAHGAV
ncbi:MAG: sigma-70 family RNA polymerase sigma factor [Planctomycetes bacterium]|nr:sigma-70 family RNA polymerase sigma factor [Planctomycetota bacterium]